MAARLPCVLLLALLVVTACHSTTEHNSTEVCGDMTMVTSDTWTPAQTRPFRIIDGLVARHGQFPHHAVVISDDRLVCGGSLISETAVLTAKQCTFKRKKFSIRMGSCSLSANDYSTWVEETIWAMGYPDRSMDVSIVFLPSSAPVSSVIRPVKLPTVHEVNDTYAGLRALISGFGKTSHDSTTCSEKLRWSEVTVVPNEICKLFYKKLYVKESTLCAGNKNAGTWSGDGGGALVLQTMSGYKQIGVASFVSSLGYNLSVPAGYVRVTSVLDWIYRNAGVHSI